MNTRQGLHFWANPFPSQRCVPFGILGSRFQGSYPMYFALALLSSRSHLVQWYYFISKLSLYSIRGGFSWSLISVRGRWIFIYLEVVPRLSCLTSTRMMLVLHVREAKPWWWCFTEQPFIYYILRGGWLLFIFRKVIPRRSMSPLCYFLAFKMLSLGTLFARLTSLLWPNRLLLLIVRGSHQGASRR